MKSIIHVYIYGLIKREANGDNIVHISRIHPIIKWTIRIPHKYHFIIIRELVEYGFLKKIGRDDYKIMYCNYKSPIDSLGNPLW